MTTTITHCRYCGKSHGVRCPEVKAIEYAEDGVTVRRVEFVTAADFPQLSATTINPTKPYWAVGSGGNQSFRPAPNAITGS